jgi:O-antigen/teichoic acid export membrane protein
MSIAVGRNLGAEALGSFSLAVAIARLYYMATDLGAGAHLSRTVARTPAAAHDLMGLFVAFRMVLIPVGIVITIALGEVLGDGYWPVSFLIALAMGMISIQTLFESLFNGFDDQRTVATFVAIGAVLVCGACGVWAVLDSTLILFSLLYTFVCVGVVSGWLVKAASADQSPQLRWNKQDLFTELSRSWPIGINTMLSLAALKCPLLIISAIGSTEDIGAYAAADMFVTATAIVQSAVTGASYPKLAAAFDRRPHEFRRVFWMSNATLAIAGLLGGAFIALVGTDILQLVFPRKDFSRSTEVLAILGWSSPALLLVHHNLMVFAAAGLERASLLVMAGWVTLIAGCQLALSPWLGVMAGAWGVLLGRSAGLVLVLLVSMHTAMHRGTRRLQP